MQTIESTPSVYFQFDDSANKTDLSSVNFDLSCTNNKRHMMIDAFTPSVALDLKEHYTTNQSENIQQLKSEQFFQEFDNNFIVTFEEQLNKSVFENTNVMKNSCQTNFIDNHFQNISFKSRQAQHISKSFPQPTHKQSELDPQKNHINTMKFQSQIISKSTKDSPTLPKFQVKKRTIFKNKQNISSNPLTFNIIAKKLPGPLGIFSGHPHTCRHQNSDGNQYFTSKATPQDSQFAKKILKRHRKSNIFAQNKSDLIQHKCVKESLKLITFDKLRKQCDIHQQSINNYKTERRKSIFQKLPLIIK